MSTKNRQQTWTLVELILLGCVVALLLMNPSLLAAKDGATPVPDYTSWTEQVHAAFDAWSDWGYQD